MNYDNRSWLERVLIRQKKKKKEMMVEPEGLWSLFRIFRYF